MKKVVSIICVFFMLSNLSPRSQDYTPFIATSAVTLLLAAGMYSWLDSYTKKTLAHHEDEFDKLVERFEDTPFEKFRVVADKKIAEVRNVGIAELNRVRKVLAEERENIRREIEQYNNILNDTRLFLSEVKDQSGRTFLGQISALKRNIENALSDMQDRHVRIDGEIERLDRDTDRLRRRFRGATTDLDHLEMNIRNAQRRERELPR